MSDFWDSDLGAGLATILLWAGFIVVSIACIKIFLWFVPWFWNWLP